MKRNGECMLIIRRRYNHTLYVSDPGATDGKTCLHLPDSQHHLLLLLTENSGGITPYEKIIGRLYPDGSIPKDPKGALRSRLKALRNYLERHGFDREIVKTVNERGLILTCEVEFRDES